MAFHMQQASSVLIRRDMTEAWVNASRKDGDGLVGKVWQKEVGFVPLNFSMFDWQSTKKIIQFNL